MISGDAMCDFDLTRLRAAHMDSGAAVTIAAYAVDDPREYGLMNIDADGYVTGFTEKPAWGQVTLSYSARLLGGGDASVQNIAWAPVDPSVTEPPSLEECPPAQDLPDPNAVSRCASTDLDRGLLTVAKQLVSQPSRLPHSGDTLEYALTLTTSGRADSTAGSPAALRDDLSDLLTGAYYLNDAAAEYHQGDQAQGEAPSPAYSASSLTWSGPLKAGQSVKVTYSVRLRNSANPQLRNVAWAPDDPFSAETPPVPECAKDEPGQPGDKVTGEPCDSLTTNRGLLTVRKFAAVNQTPDPDDSSAPGPALPGDVIFYRIDIENLSELEYKYPDDPAVVWDDLTDVLREGAYVEGSLAAAADAQARFDAESGLIRWEGAIAAAATASFTYQVKVDARGDGLIRNVAWVPYDRTALTVTAPLCHLSTDGQPVASIATGETCAALDLYSPLLAVDKKSAPRTTSLPGDRIEYTIVATNVGAVAFPADRVAELRDDLTATLDDAALVDGPKASTGDVAFDRDTAALSWSGPLARNATVRITYTVEVTGGGDGRMPNVAWQPLGEDPPKCLDAPDGVDAATGQPCALDDHLLPKLTIQKRLLTEGPYPQGKRAEYEVLITNLGGAGFTQAKPATVMDNLAELLDGGVYNHDAVATTGPDTTAAGAVSYDEPVLTWRGPLAAGQSVSLRYSITWLAIGNGTLRNVAWQPSNPADRKTPECDQAEGARLDPDTGQPCAAWLDTRPLLAVDKELDTGGKAVLTAGDVVEYVVTAKNVGQADYDEEFPAVVVDSLAGLLGATRYNYDAKATIEGQPVGEPHFDPAGSLLRWEGPLAWNQTVQIRFSITLLAGGAGVGRNVAWSPLDPADPKPAAPTCDSTGGTRDPATGEPCDRANYTRPTLSLSKWSDAANPRPGDTVTFKIVATNTSLDHFTEDVPAIVQDKLSDVLDDATFGGVADVAVTAEQIGRLVYDSDKELLTWSGPLASGQSVELAVKVVLKPTGDGLVRNVAWRPNEPSDPDPTPPSCDAASGGQDEQTLEPCAVTQFDKSGLMLTKQASPADPMPGSTVTYTLTLQNTGQLPFTESSPALLLDDFSDLIAAGGRLSAGPTVEPASLGAIDATAPGRIRWYGPLSPGGQVVLTYQVTLDDTMAAVRGANIAWVPHDPVDPPTPACADVDEDHRDDVTGELCARVQLTPPVLRIAKSSTVIRPGEDLPPPYGRPGDQVLYRLSITNIGSGAYTKDHPAVIIDAVSEVLDDATWDGSAAIVKGGGALEWTAATERLRWSGELAREAEVVIEYSVTLKAGGDGRLSNVVWVPDHPDKPEDPDQAPACQQSVGAWCATDELPLPELSINKTVRQDPPEGRLQAGTRLIYSLTLENTGPGDFTAEVPAVVRDDLTDVLDDAVWKGLLATPESGLVDWESPWLTWSGPLASGATAELSYAVELSGAGDGRLRNLAWFPADPEEPQPPARCQRPDGVDPATGLACAEVEQRRPILEIVSKQVEGAEHVRPGDWLTYTVTARNLGSAAFTPDNPAVVADSLEGVIDDAEPFDLATAQADDGGAGGQFGYDSPVLTW
ncbi:MAG: hypothetical protein LBU05_03890, partial [Bifidobacteriaceae bacterium]|nr:hypothetical protein [Bifidobacteriaceae bacterium]